MTDNHSPQGAPQGAGKTPEPLSSWLQAEVDGIVEAHQNLAGDPRRLAEYVTDRCCDYEASQHGNHETVVATLIQAALDSTVCELEAEVERLRQGTGRLLSENNRLRQERDRYKEFHEGSQELLIGHDTAWAKEFDRANEAEQERDEALGKLERLRMVTVNPAPLICNQAERIEQLERALDAILNGCEAHQMRCHCPACSIGWGLLNDKTEGEQPRDPEMEGPGAGQGKGGGCSVPHRPSGESPATARIQGSAQSVPKRESAGETLADDPPQQREQAHVAPGPSTDPGNPYGCGWSRTIYCSRPAGHSGQQHTYENNSGYLDEMRVEGDTGQVTKSPGSPPPGPPDRAAAWKGAAKRYRESFIQMFDSYQSIGAELLAQGGALDQLDATQQRHDRAVDFIASQGTKCVYGGSPTDECGLCCPCRRRAFLAETKGEDS